MAISPRRRASQLLAALVALLVASSDVALTQRVLPSFIWRYPFSADGRAPHGFDAACLAERTFYAQQHRVADLRAPSSPWAPALDQLLSWHSYPGSWDGRHWGSGDHEDRDVLIVEYRDVPGAVRKWVAEQHRLRHAVDDAPVERDGRKQESRWWMFGVFSKPKDGVEPRFLDPKIPEAAAAAGEEYHEPPDEDKVLLFAPASLYEILPLWVAEGSDCEADLLDLSRYEPHAIENAVIAWPVEHTTPSGKDKDLEISFQIRAMVTVESAENKAIQELWQKIQRQAIRENRRLEREQRLAARKKLQEPLEEQLKEVEEEHEKDEL
ncbi:hypothetical protein VTK73DRAFT_8825 [Phialemonium thermophilum]|uniref:Uncharacterized protein n=1 Tax=Phialemonium thermophilum TaxID=223376 RepID=A0ABR3W6B5_9PEZI